jgi:hypothetical protein
MLAAAILAAVALPTWDAAQATVTSGTSGMGNALTCFAVDISGSNAVASDGEPATDPGPIFVRQQVVQLYDQVLTDLGEATGQQVAVVTFGAGVGSKLGPVTLSDSAARSRLEAGFQNALHPSRAEAAWTNWVAGVNGCARMFQPSGVGRGMVVVLTDGFPQGPAGGPAQQLAAISPTAHRLWARGIAIQPVLYGAGAGQPGSARQAMSRLAAMGHGHLVLAATPLDMLRSSLRLASWATGLPLGGSETPVNGGSSIPLRLPGHTANAVLILLRSSGHVAVSVATPGGITLAALPAGAGGSSLVLPLNRPAAGTYQASANGQGSMYAAELLRLNSVRPTASARPPGQPVPRRTGAGKSSSSFLWALTAGLAVFVIAAVGALWWARSRRHPKGTLVVWVGDQHRLVDSVEVDGLMEVADLFHTSAPTTGWAVRWVHRAPDLINSDGLVEPLTSGQTRTAPTIPPSTFTWFPDGIDTSLSGEPPGRPAEAGPIGRPTEAIKPMPTSDRR